MTDDPRPLTRQAISAQNRSGKGIVSGRLKVALDEMIWQAASRDEAAKAAGMTDHSLRAALKKPHVKAYYMSGLEVLRTSERAKNIHTLARIRDGSRNDMAAVGAVKALEQLAEASEGASGRVPITPGLQIVVIQPGGARDALSAPSLVIDAVPANPAHAALPVAPSSIAETASANRHWKDEQNGD